MNVQQGFDIAFVGSGLSSTATLLKLVEGLRSHVGAAPLRVAVIEKSGQFFSGIAYGDRSGPTSLIITPLDEFLPPDDLDPFVAWMRTHKDRLAEDLEAEGGALSRDLAVRFKRALADGTCAKIHVPRSFYGRYLTEKATSLLDEAEQDGLIDCHLMHAEVAGLDRAAGGYRIRTTTGDAPSRSRIVVLGLGMPPSRKFFSTCEDQRIAARLIDDPYAPSMTDNLARMTESLKASETPNMLLIGANASCLEMLYLLCDDMDPDQRLPNVYVLSPQGKMPERFVGVDTPRFEAGHLQDLTDQDKVTAADVLEAVKADLQVARAASLGIGETMPVISRIVGKLVNDHLDAEQRETFANHVGVEIGRIQRRAGEEYSDIVDSLGEQGRLHIHKGRFASVSARDDGQLQITYQESGTGEIKTIDQPIALAVNCSGSAGLVRPNACPLIESLVESQLCMTTESSIGFKVNDRMEANDGLYVMGPMLAGNVVAGMPIWHVEHCGRILGFSNKLADELLIRMSCAVAAE